MHLLDTVEIVGDLDESLQLTIPIPTNISFEEWLKSFEVQLKSSLWLDIKKCLKEMKEGYRLSFYLFFSYGTDKYHQKMPEGNEKGIVEDSLFF